MLQACADIEEAIAEVHKQLLAVAGNKLTKNEIIRLKAEVDIMLVAHLINLPKQPPDQQTLKEQEAALEAACAISLLLKLVKAADTYNIRLAHLVASLDLHRRHNRILTECCSIATDPQELDKARKKAEEDAAKEAAKKKTSTVVELAPMAALLNRDGDVIAAPTTRAAQAEKKVEVIPWTGWLEGVETDSDLTFVKSLLKTAFFRFSEQFPLDGLPLALIRKGSDLETKATKNI